MTEYICMNCNIVFNAQERYVCECGGILEEFDPAKHGRLLVSRSNSWNDIVNRWNGNPLYEKACQNRREHGSMGHSHMITDFVDDLIEKIGLDKPDERSYYEICLKYEVTPGKLGEYINNLKDCQNKLIEVYRDTDQRVNRELWRKLINVLDEIQPGWEYENQTESVPDNLISVIGKKLAELNYLKGQNNV